MPWHYFAIADTHPLFGTVSVRPPAHGYQTESLRGHGFAKFTSLRKLHTNKYIMNDTMFLRVTFHDEE